MIEVRVRSASATGAGIAAVAAAVVATVVAPPEAPARAAVAAVPAVPAVEAPAATAAAALTAVTDATEVVATTGTAGTARPAVPSSCWIGATFTGPRRARRTTAGPTAATTTATNISFAEALSAANARAGIVPSRWHRAPAGGDEDDHAPRDDPVRTRNPNDLAPHLAERCQSIERDPLVSEEDARDRRHDDLDEAGTFPRPAGCRVERHDLPRHIHVVDGPDERHLWPDTLGSRRG